jgi:hypothetical protein
VNYSRKVKRKQTINCGEEMDLTIPKIALASDWMAVGLYISGLVLLWVSVSSIHAQEKRGERSLRIKFTVAGWDTLTEAAKKRSITEEDALRRAIDLWAVLDGKIDQDKDILIVSTVSQNIIARIKWW